MFKRILIANRGEIALRILRSCREMDIETVAVCSTADHEALAVQLATRSVCIGPPQAPASYLNRDAILTAAQATGCDAIHPGYGFLSENASFADACAAEGITFIGPQGNTIRKAGRKAVACQLMREAEVPTVPGSDGPVANVAEALSIAEEIGYPILLKASAGGGGRGIRRCDSEADLPGAFASAQAESKACFGSGEMYVEKCILNPRHIEVQILGDRNGTVIHLGDRDCSLQRRNQKLIEEAPAAALSPALREAMGEAAVRAAKAVEYENAGTVEFLLTEDGNFYFMEINTRIQVEHGVTEAVTGLDLIREQIRIAAGLPLSLKQEDVHLTGHAIECRINAENPLADFRPTPGTVSFLHFPGGLGVRIDSALYNGYTLPPYYDSLAAKIIVHAGTRLEAIRRMRRALEELVIHGFPTNASLSHMVLYHPDFIRGNYTTSFLEKNIQQLSEWSKAFDESEAQT